MASQLWHNSGMGSPSGTDPDFHVFLSYYHQDNEKFGMVVDQLFEQIQRRYSASYGDMLKIFKDTDATPWGNKWQDTINQAVDGSACFMPIITMNYFRRPACIGELSRFIRNE